MRALLTTSPGWLKALASWRVAVVAASLVGLVRVLGDAASLTNTSLWGLTIALGLTAVWSAISLLGMIKARHIGRVSSLMLDVVLASAASFLALNVMGMFVALDTAGEAFNGRVGWLVVIFVGWVISGLSEKAGDRQSQVAQIGRWIMLGGFAGLTISMGLIPGLIEFVRRAISLDALPWVVTAAAAAWFARTAFAGRATSYFSTSRTQLEAMDGLLFAAPNIIGFLVASPTPSSSGSATTKTCSATPCSCGLCATSWCSEPSRFLAQSSRRSFSLHCSTRSSQGCGSSEPSTSYRRSQAWWA
jgi:hypothetical protein